MYINGVFQVDGEADELSDYATNHIPNSLSIVTDNNCRFISTDIESNLRIKLVPFGDDPPASYTAPTDNPTFMEHEDGSLTFCLLKASNQLVLTIDDKGLQPIDGIYSGTISPPIPNLNFNFNIQWIKPDHSTNGRVWDINTDGGLSISNDGSQWFADIRNDPPRAGSFGLDGTYSLTISAYGNGYEGFDNREYIVST